VFIIEPRPYSDPDARLLVAQVQAEYVTRYGGEDAAAVEVGDFDPPGGRFVVGVLDGDPVACGGWRRLAPSVAEIKRMFVADRARRRGLARAVLADLEQRATDAGLIRLVLNTGHHQPEAIALYESSGYRPVRPYGHYACSAGALFYGKDVPRIDRVKRG
jgi:GNAT superfamily N-acetyltransferase